MLCDWDPKRNQPAPTEYFRKGEGCGKPATLVLGSRKDWHLCESCAALPRFSRFKVRLTLEEAFGVYRDRQDPRIIDGAPFDEERRTRRRDGRDDWKICRWCGGALSGRRTGWCSDDCVHEYRIRREPGYARGVVAERDLGVCSACGKDTTALMTFLLEARPSPGPDVPARHRRAMGRIWEEWFKEIMGLGYASRTSIPFLRWSGNDDTWVCGYWDMDHIKPVVEGGGGCGLDNLRTLCIPCHKRETRRLARRLAQGRRDQLDIPGT